MRAAESNARKITLMAGCRTPPAQAIRRVMALILAAILAAVLGGFGTHAIAQGAGGSGFQGFLAELWPDAQARGITRATFDAAFAGVEPDPRVMAATARQPEYGKPFGVYVGSAVSARRISGGVRKASQWNELLAAVEQKYGVERWIILSIWAVESDYGAYKPVWHVIRSLATLAHARYRDPLFRNELLAALQIIQEGHIARDKMMGSWAGALGQCQFLPSGFIKWAVDFSGDGRRDIWATVPDVLGSIANYFREHGWTPGMPWGFEVLVPKGFDYLRSRASFRDWAGLGLRRADGSALPGEHDAILFFPSGARGPAFLVTENFNVIKRYNNSDAYAVAVAHLADRMRGRGPVLAAWPQDDRPLSRPDRIALQRSLAKSRLPGERVSRPHRLRPQRRDPSGSGESRNDTGRSSDLGVAWRATNAAGSLAQHSPGKAMIGIAYWKT